MAELGCTLGHTFVAPKLPKACPYCPQGQPCPGKPEVPARSLRAVAEHPVLEAVRRGDALEVIHTGRWYRVDAARVLRSKVEVRFTTGSGPKLRTVPPASLRPRKEGGAP